VSPHQKVVGLPVREHVSASAEAFQSLQVLILRLETLSLSRADEVPIETIPLEKKAAVSQPFVYILVTCHIHQMSFSEDCRGDELGA
jgi:hypothetical protein